ncbi:phage tail family protein [Neobacillus niacini]|uniref:phage tail family protein n=1 Tax=Neobacillus niacini TaxID=86668 RepID=UPI003B029BF8
MNLTVIRKDGTVYDLNNLGIKTLDFIVSSPEYRNHYEEVEGADGVLDLGTTIGARNLSGKFVFSADDIMNYTKMRNEVFRIFLSKESFYLIDDREPNRRWEVKCNTTFKPDQILHHGLFELDFICAKGLAESVNTSLETQIVQVSGSPIVKYKHTTTSFEILNDGDETVNPRKFPLVITYKGDSTNLKIKNVTTGDEWSYTGSSTTSNTIVLDGIRSTKSGLSIFRNTNHKLITLAPGWNEFVLTGTSGAFEITFDFRFYTI